MSEKVQVQSQRYKAKSSANYLTTEETTDEYESEKKVYVGQRKQPYTINRKETRFKQKQSESIKELNLCSRKITPKPAPMEIDSEPEVLSPVPTSKPKRPRTKVQPSIVN